ncbi:hypothetical protein LI129_20185, partial [Erysipelatoclostridium ramosum]|uniref:hypothetical protein n=1 Tax=Thomasclavelia ramosa TaxID=1547 RepID=UPI001D065ECF
EGDDEGRLKMVIFLTKGIKNMIESIRSGRKQKIQQLSVVLKKLAKLFSNRENNMPMRTI